MYRASTQWTQVSYSGRHETRYYGPYVTDCSAQVRRLARSSVLCHARDTQWTTKVGNRRPERPPITNLSKPAALALSEIPPSLPPPCRSTIPVSTRPVNFRNVALMSLFQILSCADASLVSVSDNVCVTVSLSDQPNPQPSDVCARNATGNGELHYLTIRFSS